MANLLQIALGNAAVAGLLALVAVVITWRSRRRPALAHGLWLLVLLKLLTPPVVAVPLAWPAAPAEPLAPSEVVLDEAPPWHPRLGVVPAGPSLEVEVAEGIDRAPGPVDWPLLVVVGWLGGSGLFALGAA